MNRRVRGVQAASAVELALMLPVVLILVFGVVVFGSYLTMVHGVQRLAADAARVSADGSSDTERNRLANSYVARNVSTHALLDATKVSVKAAPSATRSNVYIVTVNYDAASSFIFALPFVPMPPSPIARSAAISHGEF